jgi:4-amino-4-deoxy-L-arabinose transferase-like glycosyltransferase
VLVIAGGVVCELVVRADYPGQLQWLPVMLVVVGVLASLALLAAKHPRIRDVALGAATVALLVAPTIWAFDTLGYATQSTFPSGGPAADDSAVGGFGAGTSGLFGGGARHRSGGGGPRGGFSPPVAGGGAATGGVSSLFGNQPTTGSAPRRGLGTSGGFGGGGFGAGGFGGGGSLNEVVSFVEAHGGGTIAVSSQSTAATAIIDEHANVAGIGGFSGSESDPSVRWFAQEVRSGHIRWVLEDGLSSPADGRAGATAVLNAAARDCTPADTSSAASLGLDGLLYDCAGKASALDALA